MVLPDAYTSMHEAGSTKIKGQVTELSSVPIALLNKAKFNQRTTL
jgi:hypothetical protein